MPNTVPNVTVSESDYVGISIPTNINPITHTIDAFRPVTSEINNSQVVPGRFYELGHTDVDDFSFRTDEFNTSLKELMNRIYKLELDVYVLKQQLEHGGTISL